MTKVLAPIFAASLIEFLGKPTDNVLFSPAVMSLAQPPEHYFGTSEVHALPLLALD